MASNAQFKADFAKLLKAAGDKAELVVRRTALELQTRMVGMSPVDSGRFKGNWQSSVGGINTDTSAPADTAGSGAIGRTKAVLEGWKPGQTITLTNSMPYARRLEYGWSKQAPGGMVRVTVLEYSQALTKAVESIK